ncbi:VCBS repeat-containing protein [Gemmata sp. JC717]|uniref:VCBS repeat-containing protein n=1 Tax=Gemmata algarum TaxID=2975278 RepID=UPI0021BA4AB0|nr:VCBS repeat-containing protein [Gemmata algarum]MDY3551662.1 VCBS repeat-containing protein [Gemmata algarum]
MTRFGFGFALVLALAAGAAAQPPGGKAPPVVQFKQFGTTPEQFWQSSVARWTGQIALDLETVKGEVAAAKITPLGRAAINAQIENSLRQVYELDQSVRKGAPKDKVFAEFGEVERALGGLLSAIEQSPAARQAAGPTLARIDTANQQLAAAVGAGDNSPERAKRRLLRLAEAVDDSTEELRTRVVDEIPTERGLDRALATSAREARLLTRRLRDDANPELLRQTATVMIERWAEAVAILSRLRNLPPAVTAQVTKVDGLQRRLAGALGGAVPTPPPLPEVRRFAFAVGADVGAQPRVTVFADEKGTVAYNFFAYDLAFDGGVRVDMADLNGDRIPDLIVAPGPSKNPVTLPVRVYDGRDLNLLVEFVPFAGWKGGLYAVGTDLAKDGRALIAINAEGTQHVKVFNLATGKETDSFFAHNQNVTGGVRIAWGDANGDGVADLFTVNGPGNAVTTVKVFSGKDRAVLAEFPAVDNRYTGGAFIAAGDLTGNGRADAIVGMDAGTIPLVRVLDQRGKSLVEWLAYDERYRGGVRVALGVRNRVVTASGGGIKNSPVRVFNTANAKAPVAEIVPFLGFDGGLNVGGR